MTRNSIKQCIADLKDQNSSIYENYRFVDLLTSLNKQNMDQVHTYKLESLSVKYKKILEKYGKNTFEDIRKIVLLECILSSWKDIFSDKYPESIQEQYERNINRFIETSAKKDGWGEHIEDVYWKDLSLARQQMFPAGAQIVEAYSGFGLKQGLSSNLLQSAQFLSFTIKTGGRTGYYQIHTHTPELKEFNEEGWNKCYVRIAEMLKINKEIKGMVGGSWFYDPQLEHISPRLMYLQTVPRSGGARFFHIGKDTSGNAIAKSKTRRKLHDEGKYTPRSYLLIWPREELIAWSDRFQKK